MEQDTSRQATENTAEIGEGTPDTAAALTILRRIRDSAGSTTAEKINAIKGIGALLGRDDLGERGPSLMTRDEIARELERLKELTA